MKRAPGEVECGCMFGFGVTLMPSMSGPDVESFGFFFNDCLGESVGSESIETCDRPRFVRFILLAVDI
jgi:hypothetical protein